MGPGARVRDLHRDPARETHRTAGCASVIRVRAPFLPALLVVLAVVAALAGAIPASAIALVIGVPILRLRGAYFALATIGINEAMRTAINNFEPFGGAVGMFFNFSVYDTYGGARNAALLAYGVMVVV